MSSDAKEHIRESFLIYSFCKLSAATFLRLQMWELSQLRFSRTVQGFDLPPVFQRVQSLALQGPDQRQGQWPGWGWGGGGGRGRSGGRKKGAEPLSRRVRCQTHA